MNRRACISESPDSMLNFARATAHSGMVLFLTTAVSRFPRVIHRPHRWARAILPCRGWLIVRRRRSLHHSFSPVPASLSLPQQAGLATPFFIFRLYGRISHRLCSSGRRRRSVHRARGLRTLSTAWVIAFRSDDLPCPATGRRWWRLSPWTTTDDEATLSFRRSASRQIPWR
jgi:hypothetical protein